MMIRTRRLRRQVSAASGRRGLTLVETLVSIGILSFITGFMAFLVYMSSINAYNVHDQVMGQSSAATAAERITSLLREASSFQLCSGDTLTSDSRPVQRIQFTVPPLESSWGVARTSVICLHPGNSSANPPVAPSVYYYADADEADFSGTTPTGEPDLKFPNIQDLDIRFESEFRVELSLGFTYRGFALAFVRPEVPQLGRLTTEVIAKNRFLPFGSATAYPDSYDANETTSIVHL